MHLGVDFYAPTVYSKHCQEDLTHKKVYNHPSYG